MRSGGLGGSEKVNGRFGDVKWVGWSLVYLRSARAEGSHTGKL
jgi:hypothetical protein